MGTFHAVEAPDMFQPHFSCELLHMMCRRGGVERQCSNILQGDLQSRLGIELMGACHRRRTGQLLSNCSLQNTWLRQTRQWSNIEVTQTGSTACRKRKLYSNTVDVNRLTMSNGSCWHPASSSQVSCILWACLSSSGLMREAQQGASTGSYHSISSSSCLLCCLQACHSLLRALALQQPWGHCAIAITNLLQLSESAHQPSLLHGCLSRVFVPFSRGPSCTWDQYDI